MLVEENLNNQKTICICLIVFITIALIIFLIYFFINNNGIYFQK